MVDEADLAQERQASLSDTTIRGIRERANIPAGNAGICDDCGHHSPRLVMGFCAPCRDEKAALKRRKL